MGDRDDNRYGRERGYGSRGSDDDRGFVERAGDEVRGWFRNDDEDRSGRGRGGDEREGGRGYQGGYGRGGPSGNSDRDHGLSYGARGYSAQGNDEYRRDDGRGYARGRDFGHDDGRSRPYGAGGFGDRNYGGMDRGGAGFGAVGRSQEGGRDAGGRTTGGQGLHDPHYHQWRERQVQQLDRDYEEYRREHQQRFETEFHGWRTARQGQRDALRQVKEHQEVVGDDGGHVGTVDKVRGDQIILTKNDPDAGGRHHAIPSSWIQGVGEKVMLNRNAAKAKTEWQDWERDHQQEERGRDGTAGGQPLADRALGHENDRDAGGPHVLERSFSGTYDRERRDD